jgi:hypothetical protein
MPPQCAPDALAGESGAGENIAGRRCDPYITPRRAAPEIQRIRQQHLVERVHRLGARVVYELLDEIRRHHPEIADDLDRRLAAYADRLDPDLLRAMGGDRFPAQPIHAVGGDR